MTTQTNAVTTITLKSVMDTLGKEGPQWELHLAWPWSTAKYDDKVWLEQKDFPESPKPGVHNVFYAQTYPKKKADGTQYDGSRGWMWNFKILGFTEEAVTAMPTWNQPAQPTATWLGMPMPPSEVDALFTGKPEPGGEERIYPPFGAVRANAGSSSEDAKWDAIRDEKNHQIRRGQAFNAAVEKIDSVFFGSAMDMDDAELRMRRLRDMFMRVLDSDPASPHHCYDHDVAMNKGNTGYGHKVEGGWCIEDRGIIMDEGE